MKLLDMTETWLGRRAAEPVLFEKLAPTNVIFFQKNMHRTFFSKKNTPDFSPRDFPLVVILRGLYNIPGRRTGDERVPMRETTRATEKQVGPEM